MAPRPSAGRSGSLMLALASSILPFLAAFHAQASQTGDFSALRDTLARLSDVSEIRRLESARKPQGRTAAAKAHAEQGWIALRLYDLTHDPADNKRAIRAFETALDRDSTSGWAHYGLGLSLLSSPEARWLGEGGSKGRVVLDDAIRKLMGVDPRTRARHAFNAALRATPPVRSAARDLARLALVTWRPQSLVEARDALLAVVESGPPDPDVLLTLSEIHAALGEGAPAAERADRAVALIGANAITLRIAALAHFRKPGGAEEGARRYMEDRKSVV